MRKSKKLCKQIVTELEKMPNISLVCAKLGVARQTFYRWKLDDPDFSDEVDDALQVGYESVNDLAESKVVERIKDGDFRASKYWLENNSKRYIRPRPSNSHHSPKVKPNIVQFVDFSEKPCDCEKNDDESATEPPDNPQQ